MALDLRHDTKTLTTFSEFSASYYRANQARNSSMDRRYFLKTTGIGLASFGLMAAAPDFLHQFASGQAMLNPTTGKKRVLVTVFQRGAVDGLNVLVPYGESEYYNLRPTIAVPKPGQTDGALRID